MAIRSNGIMGGVLVVGGALVGAGVALLCAPRSGRTTRREISFAARKSGRRMRRAVRDVSDEVSSLVDSVEDLSASVLDRGREAMRSAKQELAERIEACGETLNRGRGKLTHLFS